MIRQESLRKSVDEPVRFADADEKTHKSFLGCISVPVSQDQTPLASGGVGVRRSSRARRLALPFCVAFLSVLVVILIAVVAWLVVIMKRLVREVRVRRVASQRLASRRLTRRPLPTQNPPVALSYGPVTTSGYSSWGSLFRGSVTWVVNPNPMPFGGISDMGVVSDADYLYVFGGGRVAEPALFDAIPRRQATAPIMTDGLWWPLIYARLQPPPRCRESISSCSATRRRSNG